MRISWCSTLVFLFSVDYSIAQISIDVSRLSGKESLRNRCYFLSTHDTVHANDVAKIWFQTTKQFDLLDRFNRGYESKTIWIALLLKNLNPAETYLLEIDNPHLDRVQAFCASEKSIEPLGFETGDDMPFASRAIQHRNFVWRLEKTCLGNTVILIRAQKRNSAFSIPIYITTLSAFTQAEARATVVYGLVFGMMLVVGLYSLLIGFFLKRTVYFAYFFFIVCSILLLTTAEGFSFQFLYPKWGKFNSVFRVAIAGVSSCAFMIFSSLLLNTKQYTPTIAKIVQVIIIVFGLLLVTTPFLYEQYMAISLVMVPTVLTLAVVGPLLLAWCAIKSLSQQREISMFFLVAYSLVIIASGLMVLEDYGWIEKLPFNVLFAGALSEILVFSIAITYLIKNMYEERNALSIRIRKHQTELLQSYVTGVERERYRVSRELHDDIGSRLTTLKRMIAQGANPKYDIEFKVDALARDIRLISHQLAPPSLANNDLLGLIESFLADVRQSAAINASVENYDFPSMLQEEVKTQLFRVVQEAVQNVVKHACARNLTIQLFNHAQKLVISIEDDGKGFDTTQTQKGLGFANMLARVHGLGGVLDVSSSAGGTVVMLEVPTVIP